MVRRTILAAALAAVPLLASAPPATAGGGCHMGVTTGTGDTVAMVDACFTPTTLRVEPGTTVTWINEDPMTHNVMANGWGHFEPMEQGDVARATFDDPGIYPYACTYHPGMSGAIVVGDGTGKGNGAAVTVESWQPPTQADAAPAAEPASSSGTSGSSSALAWVGGAILGFALAVAGGAVRSASRREALVHRV
jgi:plastocyanin